MPMTLTVDQIQDARDEHEERTILERWDDEAVYTVEAVLIPDLDDSGEWVELEAFEYPDPARPLNTGWSLPARYATAAEAAAHVTREAEHPTGDYVALRYRHRHTNQTTVTTIVTI